MTNPQFLNQAIKWILPYILPSAAKCFMYVLIILAFVWTSIASYYYFSEDYTRSYGASISIGICGLLALIASIWDSYSCRKNMQVQNNSISDLVPIIPKNYLLIKTIYDQVKNYYAGKHLKASSILLVPTALILIYMFLKRK